MQRERSERKRREINAAFAGHGGGYMPLYECGGYNNANDANAERFTYNPYNPSATPAATAQQHNTTTATQGGGKGGVQIPDSRNNFLQIPDSRNYFFQIPDTAIPGFPEQ